MTITQYERTPEITVEERDSETAHHMKETWESKPGLYGFLATVDHKEIGIRYIVTAFAFLIAGGIEALIMRLQLAQPDLRLLTPEQYNELFSMHGITMILWYAFPVLTGISVFVQPLIIGSREMAFPRLNAFTYWAFLFSGLFLYTSFAANAAPNDGWFNYTPYAEKRFNPTLNIDFYALANILLGISTTLGAINFVVTILRQRAPGMSINRLPMMSWGTLTISVGLLFAQPSVTVAFFLLWMDRNFNTQFYQGTSGVGSGGQPLLWQHLFWIWGHPWVYAIVLPAISIISQVLPVHCRRPIVGYTAVALATVLTMVLGFGVWLHHMFATGLSNLALSFFSAVSILIVIPSAVSFFAWIATIWTGRPVPNATFLFLAGYIFVFVIGGVSGFMTGSVPVDWQLTDTYFVVGHIHYVLIGWNLFAVMSGIYHWFPKMTGRLLSERIGKWNFWLMFIGFNVGFFPMHVSGLLGMPRRIYTYQAGMGWDALNLITTVGAYVFALGFFLLLVNVAVSLKRGRQAGPNPWDADSLEWSTSSPPPPYNYLVIPTVASRSPLWEDRLQAPEYRSSVHEGLLLDHGKETIATTVLDAEPEAILKMNGDTVLPLLTAIALTAVLVFALIHWWAVAGAAAFVGLIITAMWLWPREELGQTARLAPQ